MKNTFLIFLIMVAIASGYSCKKKKSDPPPTPPDNFQPATAGSTWSYSSVSNGKPAVNYTLTATGNDTLINGGTYKIFSNSGGPNEYYNKTGNDYSRYSFFETLNQAVELLYLKENYAVGQKWTQRKNATISSIGVNVTADLECEVVEKKINYAVNGKTFTEVTHIKINPTFYALGNPINTSKAEIHYYFANNVGYIYSSTEVVIPIASYSFVGTVTLKSYNIK